MSRYTLRATLSYLADHGGVSGPSQVDVLYEESYPRTESRPFAHQVRLQALVGSHHLLRWLDHVMDKEGWAANHVRTARTMLAAGARTVSRSARFCKQCRRYAGLHAAGCGPCKCGVQRGCGQFTAEGRIQLPPDSRLHRVFALPLQAGPKSSKSDHPVRYVDVLQAELEGPIHLVVHGDGELEQLSHRLQATRDSAPVLATYLDAHPLLARHVTSDCHLKPLEAALEHWATVRVQDVSLEVDPGHGEGEVPAGEHLVVLDDLVPATGFDWRSLEDARENVKRCLECYHLVMGPLKVIDTDAETAFIPVGGTARQVQPFIERGSTLRIHLDGEPDRRRKLVHLLEHDGMRTDSRGVGLPVSVYPVTACEGLTLP